MNNVLEKSLNYYNILQIEQDSKVSEIKKAYKKLVLKYHPDVCKDDESSEKFKEITKAYNILKNEESRAEYDIQLKQNKSFLPKINFQYCYHEFIKKKDKILDIFKIIFKNIRGKNEKIKLEDIESEDPFFKYEISLQKELFEMSTNELEERLQFSQNKYVRMNAAIALGYKREKKVYSTLESMINDPYDEVKKAIIWAIGNLGMKNSAPLLKILYKSNDSKFKKEILKAIYKISGSKSSDFYEMLISTINDQDENNKKEALNLLLRTDRKILYDDIKEGFFNISNDIRTILDKVIAEKKILNFPEEEN
jgi:curved DNA-binding protein CbpA